MTGADKSNVAEQLTKLAALHTSGALSDDEFAKLKAEVIAYSYNREPDAEITSRIVGAFTSTNAETKKTPKGKIAHPGCLILLAILIIFIGGIMLIGVFNPSPPTPDDKMATYMCADFIKKDLRDPSSAEFISDVFSGAYHHPEGWYAVYLKLRANNAFGGKSIMTYFCAVEKNADGHWIRKSLQIIEQK